MINHIKDDKVYQQILKIRAKVIKDYHKGRFGSRSASCVMNQVNKELKYILQLAFMRKEESLLMQIKDFEKSNYKKYSKEVE